MVSVSSNAFMFTPSPPTPRVAAELKRLGPSIAGAHVTMAERDRSTVQWAKVVHETSPTRLEWLDRAGRVVRVIDAPAVGLDSATSVGDFRAPIEG